MNKQIIKGKIDATKYNKARLIMGLNKGKHTIRFIETNKNTKLTKRKGTSHKHLNNFFDKIFNCSNKQRKRLPSIERSRNSKTLSTKFNAHKKLAGPIKTHRITPNKSLGNMTISKIQTAHIQDVDEVYRRIMKKREEFQVKAQRSKLWLTKNDLWNSLANLQPIHNPPN